MEQSQVSNIIAQSDSETEDLGNDFSFLWGQITSGSEEATSGERVQSGVSLPHQQAQIPNIIVPRDVATEDLNNDFSFLWDLVGRVGAAILLANPEQRNNPGLVLRAIKNGCPINRISKELRLDFPELDIAAFGTRCYKF